LTLADLGGVCERVLHAMPDVLRNFDTVSVRPRHEGNLLRPYFAAHRRNGVAKGRDCLGCHACPMGEGRELYAQRKGGEQCPVEIGLNPIGGEGVPAVVVSIIDISARKKAEERMQFIARELSNIVLSRQGYSVWALPCMSLPPIRRSTVRRRAMQARSRCRDGCVRNLPVLRT